MIVHDAVVVAADADLLWVYWAWLAYSIPFQEQTLSLPLHLVPILEYASHWKKFVGWKLLLVAVVRGLWMAVSILVRSLTNDQRHHSTRPWSSQ